MLDTTINRLFDQLEQLREERKKSKGRGKAVLYELEKNFNRILLWKRNGVDIDVIIAELSTAKWEALHDSFDSSDIKIKKITKTTVKDHPADARYIGWSSEKLISSIYAKIETLKDLVRLDPDNKKVRKAVRLDNVLRLIRLLTRHVSH
ncbi:MAG: hypothetical protein AAF660_02915 [Pseudomonadota bacterium]